MRVCMGARMCVQVCACVCDAEERKSGFSCRRCPILAGTHSVSAWWRWGEVAGTQTSWSLTALGSLSRSQATCV